MTVKFTIPGPPVGKGRPRVTREGHAYTPKKTVEYENLVRLEYERQCRGVFFGQGVPLDMRVFAYYPIPKSASKKKQQLMRDKKIRPCKTPDSDNVIKSVADSCNKVAYYDDSQIVDCQVRKFYSDVPRVVVIIQEVED